MMLAAIAITIVATDQLTKWLVQVYLPLHHSVTVIPGLFDLTHILNPGGAFGMFAEQSLLVRRILFLFVSSIAAGVVLYFYHNTPKTHRFLAAGFALIFGGAIGNLIDRMNTGKVVDFLDFYISQYHWPAFNVADSAITIGVTVFAYHILFNKMPEQDS